MKNLFHQIFSAIGICTLLLGCAGNEMRPETPDLLTDRGDAVYKIVFLSDTDISYISRTNYENVLQNAGSGHFFDFLYAERVKECKQLQENRCLVNFSGFATAFLANNPSTLWTVRHAFDPLIENFMEKHKTDKKSRTDLYQEFMQLHPQFLLYDKYKNIVFDTRKKSDSANFIFIGDPQLMRDFACADFTQLAQDNPKDNYKKWGPELQSGIAGKLTDFAKIQLNQPLVSKPLKFAEKLPDIGDPIFLLGYPRRSDRQTVYSARYYDGHSFHVSTGRVSTPQEMYSSILEKYRVDKSDDKKILQLFEKFFFYHDAPSAEGFSGGPILNEDGEVVTIQSSGTESGGFGLNPSWMNNLEREFSSVSSGKIKK